MPYVHGPGAAAKAADVPVEEARPTLELAGHIAHILDIAYDQLRTKELAAQGWDVKTQGIPFDPDEWPRFQVAIVQILEYCKAQANLDRPGISD